MEILLTWIEDRVHNKTKANGPFTLCCSRRHRKTGRGTQIIPETELEQERFDAALRRNISLVLAGKMKRRSYRIEALFM
jgi:hypothetical protein